MSLVKHIKEHDKLGIEPLDNVTKALAFKRKVSVGFAGTSISNALAVKTWESALLWYLYSTYSGDIDWDERTVANGGRNFTVGGSNSTDLISVQLPQVLADPPDVLFMDFVNDDYSTQAGTLAAVANVKTIVAAALAGGVQMCVLCAIQPETTKSAAIARGAAEFNTRIKNYADITPGVYYLDYTAGYIVPGATDLAPIGGAGGDAGDVVKDGAHPSAQGARNAAPYFAPLIQRIAPHQRQPRMLNMSDVFDATNAPSSNILGTRGLMLGTNGLFNGVATAGVAANWTVTTHADMVGLTPSIVTSAGTPGQLPANKIPPGFRMQRFDLAGTMTALRELVMLGNTLPDTSAIFNMSPKLSFGVIIRLIDVVGLSSCAVQISSSGAPAWNVPVASGDVMAADDMPAGDYVLFLYDTRKLQAFPGNYNANMNFRFAFRSGVTISGAIEIGFAGIWPNFS